MRLFSFFLVLVLTLFLLPEAAQAADQGADLTRHWAGWVAIGLFAIAYVFIIVEERLHLRKSKPILAAAGFMWMLVAMAYHGLDRDDDAVTLLRHNLLEYAELLLFLLVAMVFINTLTERNVFQVLRQWLVSRGYSLRTLYWVTGIMAFCMSPLADNLTTALVLGAVAIAVGAGHKGFITVCCINIVVAANAGGAFSPFGDITTLMVWQKGLVRFFEFFTLFLPALVSWLIPAVLMSLTVPKTAPSAPTGAVHKIKPGGWMVLVMFLGTIAMTVSLHQTLHLPPFLGMMTGLGLLTLYSYFIRLDELRNWEPIQLPEDADYKPAKKPFDIFISMKRVEWDTLMFFYGVVLCVGALGAFGYLSVMSSFFYNDIGPTWANIFVGFASAIVDNIPVMFAVLSMNPDMTHNQWLLVTLTAGIGGSMLSIGSAAGVALMGQARGVYTFLSHLKWSWAILLGYGAGIATHIWLNGLGPAH
ncbi:MAG TPA: sodium:proton antiporter NhaD [Alphaproteobacteria bacterium]|nr:sodium:proton antiporter NhaD [Alphaproteobacteria bacterium]